ncbi:unnamed protein product [Durusdinium trenchii]|uniref:Uncharacterized protein n=2 Tax=Durusdinium trenchii TaxID=1381693 RepID=A0ABP0QMD9_9DINO
MPRSWILWILASLGLLMVITLLNGEIRLMPTSMSFSLKTRDGRWVSNEQVEDLEQKALLKHWDGSWTTGINIGVYVGTSCIFLDKLLEKNDAKASTACVDTNVNIQPTLQENLRLNHRHVHNLNGLLAELSHCPAEMTVVDHVEPKRIGNETLTPGKPGMPASFEGMGDRGGLPDTFVIERCYTVNFVRELFAGHMPQVWFIDIDGFLPSLYQQIHEAFDDPSVELILYERDRPYSAPGKASTVAGQSDHVWEAQYRDMEDGFKRQGFRALQCDNIMWGIWVWRRGGPSFTIHLWLLLGWMACLVSMCLLSDLLVPPKVKKWPVPVWRLLVLLCWRMVYEALPSLPVNMTDPITGLDCTWICIHHGLAFAISNFLFLYVAVLWPLAKALALRTWAMHPFWLPWVLFTAIAESQLLLGFLLHALLRAPAVPPVGSLCFGPGPQQSMWELSVGTTLALSLGLLLFVEMQPERPPPV